MNSNTTTETTDTAALLSATPPTRPQPQAVELLTQAQLAERLGISLRTVCTWVRNRTVPMIKVRGFCRFDFAKVRAALEKHERPSVGAQQSDASSPEGAERSPSAAPATR